MLVRLSKGQILFKNTPLAGENPCEAGRHQAGHAQGKFVLLRVVQKHIHFVHGAVSGHEEGQPFHVPGFRRQERMGERYLVAVRKTEVPTLSEEKQK